MPNRLPRLMFNTQILSFSILCWNNHAFWVSRQQRNLPLTLLIVVGACNIPVDDHRLNFCYILLFLNSDCYCPQHTVLFIILSWFCNCWCNFRTWCCGSIYFCIYSNGSNFLIMQDYYLKCSGRLGRIQNQHGRYPFPLDMLTDLCHGFPAISRTHS